jgi:1-aminocyclopropane-1-carboxylate deaminase/D-cysteine desulfhydrase-like pyridoxal-dependent ACC family enzyme
MQKELFDTICLACGTATTLAGIALSLHLKQKITENNWFSCITRWRISSSINRDFNYQLNHI